MLPLRLIVAGIAFAISLYSQRTAREALDAAYAHQQASRLAEAREDFEQAIALDGADSVARLDYAYLLLRVGATEAGRDQLKLLYTRQPEDERLALEYAYLCYETGRRSESFEVFLRLGHAKDEKIRAQATQTWDRLNAELLTSIARWTEAAAKSPDSYSVHEELAHLLEDRNDWIAAAAEYRVAFGLKLDKRSFLLDIARVEREALRMDYANAALLAASRAEPPGVAEEARERLLPRYPYVYEFRMAIEMDRMNVPLRRELGFLLLKMGREQEAVAVFTALLKMAPDDALSLAQLAFLKVQRPQPRSSDTGLSAVRDLADQSVQKGYLKDALKYLQQLQEANPDDASTMLRLGWAHNMLKQDQEAMHWFGLARKSTDEKIAAEADQAYRNLRPSLAPMRVTAWVLPFFSTRWHQEFTYGQVKLEFKLPFTSLRPYLSARLIGDLGAGSPQGLSERAVVGAVGIATPRVYGWMAWGEAGTSWQYFASQQGVSNYKADYRGGANFTRGFGAANLGAEGGWFGMSTFDAVYLSRFDHDTLFYSQNRFGVHLRDKPLQIYANLHLTADLRRTDWANYFELGPGLRWRPPGLPRSLYLFADAVYGRHLLAGNGGKHSYYDVRAGVWYAFTY